MESKTPYRTPSIEIEHIASEGVHLRLAGAGEFIVDDVVVGYPVEQTDEGIKPNRAQLVTRIELVAVGECIVMSLAELEHRLSEGNVSRIDREGEDRELHREWEEHGLL